MSTDTLLTAEQYALLRDDRPMELVRGRVRDLSHPGWKHGLLTVRIATALHLHVEGRGIGRVFAENGYVTQRGPDSVRGPDVSFVSSAHFAEHEGERPWFEGAPDLAVEIRSPDNSMRELYGKAEEYLAGGGTLVWIIEPDRRQVHVMQKGAGRRLVAAPDELDGSPVLPGFRLPLSALFAY